MQYYSARDADLARRPKDLSDEGPLTARLSPFSVANWMTGQGHLRKPTCRLAEVRLRP